MFATMMQAQLADLLYFCFIWNKRVVRILFNGPNCRNDTGTFATMIRFVGSGTHRGYRQEQRRHQRREEIQTPYYFQINTRA